MRAKHFSPARVLLDERLPSRLRRHLAGHEVRTVPEAGWAARKDGELLQLAWGQYDAFLTMDGSLVHQNAIPPDLAVITLKARSNRLESLQPLVPQILEAVASIQPGEHVLVGS